MLGNLLPDLIRDAQLAVQGHEGAERRQAQVILADLLGLAQMCRPAGLCILVAGH
ncbi:hypothetical protein QLQ12_40800 [Actinoplanes sp. NEAU-A12]|uniref:Uncharacterized protein n=1 Tax=Actinoplanes sandaracinus TaxID=3045177 RepID=A0ABT6WZB7_9ACTN|nr:hypothetical protein [Actinoplanes sandaracinus]